MCGGDNAHVDFARGILTKAGNFSLLQHAQQAALDIEGNITDFVEQPGATLGGFEHALVVADRTSERTTRVAEELIADQSLGQAGTVDGQ